MRARFVALAAFTFGASDLAYINLVLGPELAHASATPSPAPPPVLPAPDPTTPEVRSPAARVTAKPSSDSRAPVLTAVHFARGSTVLEPEARPVIAEAARAMRQDGQLRLLVQGHADASGSESVNVDLSWGRAKSVAQALGASGIDSRRIRIEGKGSRVPLVPNRSESDMATNRRAEFVWEK
jgi:outer membrane protein OmpA-like peptidoglycan-associated protein